MTYLEYEEYKELSVEAIEEDRFNVLLPRAEQVIDTITRYHYRNNLFAEDHEWRKDAVKLAVMYQIEFFVEKGATTLEGIQSQPDSFSAGRTSITNRSSRSRELETEKSLLATGARNALVATGLLYRGVQRK